MMSEKKVLGKSLELLLKENHYEKIRGLNFTSPLFLIDKKILDDKEKEEKVFSGKI